MRNETKNAIISSAVITKGDRDILDAWLHLDYGSAGQGFGGYALYLPKSYDHHSIDCGFSGHFIYRCLEIAGVDKWDQLQGRSIRVIIEDGLIKSIGHIIKDDWFTPSIDFNQSK